MTEHPDPNPAPNEPGDGNTITPLPGEAGIPNVATRPGSSVSRKGLLAVGLLLGSMVAVSAVSIQRFAASGNKSEEAQAKRAGNRPTAANAEPRRLELSMPPTAAASAASAPGTSQQTAASPRIPALEPTPEEVAEAIPVRRTVSAAPNKSTGPRPLPEDAPVLLVSSRPGTSLPSARERLAIAGADPDLATETDPVGTTQRNLQDYQRRLQGLLDTLSQSTAAATGQGGVAPAAGPLGARGLLPPAGATVLPNAGTATTATGGLFGGQLPGSATTRVAATWLGNRSLTLPKGTAFTCALKTKVVSATSGFLGCLVQRNVYGDDGRVLLIERGSHLDGEYRIASVRPGTVRIPVLWTRIRTPHGVTVDIASPGTGPLGESGIDGYVDNRWGERIGAAMLLSLIDDSVKLVIQNQANDSHANTVVLPSTTANTSKLAEKVLDSTINIPPLIYQNQGGIVGIYVARDVDFSSVYELAPSPR